MTESEPTQAGMTQSEPAREGNTVTILAVIFFVGLIGGSAVINLILPKFKIQQPTFTVGFPPLAQPVVYSPPTPAPYYRAVPTSAPSYRDGQIDAYVDKQVEAHWRPMPGGNSKEDAARVTKDILKAKSWEELESTIRFHSSQGR